MTFIVNHDGVVFSKDLGADTAKVAGAITAYDPDEHLEARGGDLSLTALCRRAATPARSCTSEAFSS